MGIINIEQITFYFPDEEGKSDMFEQTHDMKEWKKSIGYKDITFIKEDIKFSADVLREDESNC